MLPRSQLESVRTYAANFEELGTKQMLRVPFVSEKYRKKKQAASAAQEEKIAACLSKNTSLFLPLDDPSKRLVLTGKKNLFDHYCTNFLGCSTGKKSATPFFARPVPDA